MYQTSSNNTSSNSNKYQKNPSYIKHLRAPTPILETKLQQAISLLEMISPEASSVGTKEAAKYKPNIQTTSHKHLLSKSVLLGPGDSQPIQKSIQSSVARRKVIKIAESESSADTVARKKLVLSRDTTTFRKKHGGNLDTSKLGSHAFLESTQQVVHF
jgi:hypothetical protein